jgi:hypothetical protein
MLSMPIEEPARKMQAIEERLRGGAVPGVDIVFLADWTLNACDEKRGVPRLVNLLHATDADIRVLAGYYESYVSRRGRQQCRIRRERRAIRGFEGRLRDMIETARAEGPRERAARCAL